MLAVLAADVHMLHEHTQNHVVLCQNNIMLINIEAHLSL